MSGADILARLICILVLWSVSMYVSIAATCAGYGLQLHNLWALIGGAVANGILLLLITALAKND